MTAVDQLLRNRILVGDALDQLQRLPDASVDMVLTSPPYFRLRDYDVAGQLGLESHVEEWVNNLFLVSRELRRVLLPTGTLWLNLGDSYSIHQNQGAAEKGLLLGPERLTLALIQDGWLLRNKIVWQKANPMPSPVRDRLAATWEAVYVFARSPRYFFDLDSVREPHTSSHKPIKQRAASLERWRSSNSNDTPTVWHGSKLVDSQGTRSVKIPAMSGGWLPVVTAVSTTRLSQRPWPARQSKPVHRKPAATAAGLPGNAACSANLAALPAGLPLARPVAVTLTGNQPSYSTRSSALAPPRLPPNSSAATGSVLN